MPLTTQLLCRSLTVQFKLLYWHECWMNAEKKLLPRHRESQYRCLSVLFLSTLSPFVPFFSAPVSVTLNLHPSRRCASQSPYVASKCKCIISKAARNACARLRITYQSVLLLMTRILSSPTSSSSFPSVLKCRRAHYIEIQEVISQW